MLIDYYSNFPLIRNMVTSSTKEVCVVLNSIFSEYGCPRKFWSLTKDHVTQLLNLKSLPVKICEALVVHHSFHHLSNGCSERAIQEVKKTFANVSQRALTLTYHYYSIELLPRPQERKVLQNYLDTNTEICYLTSR